MARIQQEYVKITSSEQKTSYAAEFERDYEEYVKLKKREKEVLSYSYQEESARKFKFLEHLR